jgi:hypothetical protein
MSTLRLTTISNQGGTASVPSDTVINGSAKAWVNFNGTGTVAIRAAFNVSSITDNGTGDYTLNFTNAMPDANYSLVANGTQPVFNNFDALVVGLKRSLGEASLTTSGASIRCTNNADMTGNSAIDAPVVTVAIFR